MIRGIIRAAIIRAAVELLISMLLAFLAGDELYLYYSGAWRDLSKFMGVEIEVIEVVLLYACIVLGLSYFAWRVRHIRKRGFHPTG